MRPGRRVHTQRYRYWQVMQNAHIWGDGRSSVATASLRMPSRAEHFGGYLRTGRGSAPVPNVVRSRAVKCGFLFLGCCHARSGPGMGWAANDGAVRPALRLLGRLTVRFLEPARVVGERWQTGKWGLYRHEQLRC